MNRILYIFLILCIYLGLLTGCTDNDDINTGEETIRNAVIEEFMKLSEIPRESGHVKEISSYLRAWAKVNGLKAVRDKYYNVIIDKPASKGYENAPITIIQCHMDMIVKVAEGLTFDSLIGPINVINNGENLISEGTSLGADNGIGVATALYILKNAIYHGPIRVIITADEETTMNGAEKINSKYLKGDYLINLDWQSDKSICISGAGTASYTMRKDISWASPKNAIAYQLTLSGLKGGDSIENINEGGANAIKIIGETLAIAQGEGILFELAAFNGGVSKETIPTDASAHIVINESDIVKFNKVFDSSFDSFDDTYGGVEKNYSFTLTEAPMPEKVVAPEDNSSIISFIYGIVNGVQDISSIDNDLIGSSSNIGVASTATGNFISEVSSRSVSPELTMEINNAHEAISSMCNLVYSNEESIPIWVENPNSQLVPALMEIYNNLYDKKMTVTSVDTPHECGWFIQKNPDLDMVSIGPLIKNADTTDETLSIKTISKPVIIILKFLQLTK